MQKPCKSANKSPILQNRDQQKHSKKSHASVWIAAYHLRYISDELSSSSGAGTGGTWMGMWKSSWGHGKRFWQLWYAYSWLLMVCESVTYSKELAYLHFIKCYESLWEYWLFVVAQDRYGHLGIEGIMQPCVCSLRAKNRSN